MSYDQLLSFLIQFAGAIFEQLPFIAAFVVIYSAFSIFKSQSCNPDRVWWRNSGLWIDFCYGVVNMLLMPYLVIPVASVIILIFSPTMTAAEITDYMTHGRGPVSGLPFWWQALFFFVIGDLITYWIHRLFHRHSMWKFHAIHHSGEVVDWTTAYRGHPINLMLQPVLVSIVMQSLGVSSDLMITFVPLEALCVTWIHSNSNWTLGPLRYIVVTPVYHRWHHTSPSEGGNSNFAGAFAFWDLLFGTYYMPEGKLPQEFGIDDQHFPTTSFVEQLIYPFNPSPSADQSSSTTAQSTA